MPPATKGRKATLAPKGRPAQPDPRDRRVTRATAVHRANQGRPDRRVCKGHRVLKVSRVHRVRAARLARKVFAAPPRLFRAPQGRPVRLAPLALLASPVRRVSPGRKVRWDLRANKVCWDQLGPPP